MFDGSLDQLETAIDALAETDLHCLPDSVLIERHERVLRATRRLEGLQATSLQLLDNRQATTVERGRATRAWLVEEQRVSPREADARMRVARASITRPELVEAMTAGDISLKHAELITNFLPKLDADDRDVAERELTKAALARGMRELRDRMCLDETAEERAVRQHEGRWLRFTETFDGMVRLEAMLPPAEAAVIKTAITSLAQPAGELDERHIGQRRADGLVELAHIAMDRGQLPDTAGEPTQAMVVADIDDLARRLRPGDTGRSTLNGTPITPNTVRMHACDAGIIPVVMRGTSEILDLGRSTRTWTIAQRRAARLRAGGHCESPGCQTAIDRCHLHHDHYWSHGGKTDVDNAIYLCRYHHWVVHHTTWTISRNKHGTVEIRRT